VGDIIQESRATSSHYTRAASSESAGLIALLARASSVGEMIE
jgi:hypothetical protein